MRAIHTVIRNRRALKESGRLIVLLIALALVGINRGPSPVAATSTVAQPAVLQTATVPMLAGTFQAVNNGPGDQTDPHVGCNFASYTNDDYLGSLSIRYFDFATNTDHGIPGNGASVLSDIYGELIAFTEAAASGSQIVIFDTATQSRSVVPSSGLRGPAIGANLIAFEDRNSILNPNESEIGIYDLNTEGLYRLTTDSLLDKNPAVSATGNALVWKKCQTNGTGCDIYSAIRVDSGTFVINRLSGAGEDRGPDTNGQLAVYISDKSGENDVYFQPIGGGTETQLPIPGDQRDVSISANLIAFESFVGTQYDIFVYDVSTDNLYRVTNTLVNETLSDIIVCNGIGRIVYAAPGADFDLFAFTFQLPSSTEDQIEDLIELIESFNLPAGIEISLITKLQDALTAIDASDIAAACDSLTAFINECQAQSGKKITTNQASQLITSANQIVSNLGCP